MPPDFDVAYRAMSTRDARFDGQFVTAVRTTGIYCRPACPSRTPNRGNVTFYATPAAAQAAGYRACRRCIPDAAPGSPEWNARADTVGAAMRLIGDGVVDREGVPGLARRLGYSERHLTRMLTAELGTGPLALARAKRADTARILLTRTALPATEIAFAAGFSSIRQFNDTVREVYATTPSALRALGGASAAPPAPPGVITLRLAVRPPFHADALTSFLAARAIPGVELVAGHRYARTLRLPNGPGIVVLTLPAAEQAAARANVVTAALWLTSLGDLAPAVQRCRRLLDADADPIGIDSALAADPVLAAAVERAPGLRVPGAVDGPEILMRALVGQQVSVAAARTKLAVLAARADERVDTQALIATRRPTAAGTEAAGGPGNFAEPIDPAALAARLTHLFPSADALAALGPAAIAGPQRRAATIADAAADIAAGRLVVDAGRRTAELTDELVARNGIGPWTAGYVAMRVLGDPDIALIGDLALRHGASALGLPKDPKALAAHAERWRPFRSYAGMYLWRNCPRPVRARRATDRADHLSALTPAAASPVASTEGEHRP